MKLRNFESAAMETRVDAVMYLVKSKYGSAARLSEAINVPVTSIYCALDRGFTDTGTELTDKIYRELDIE